MNGTVLRVLPDRERVEEELLANLGTKGVALGADLLTLGDFLRLFEAMRDDGRKVLDGLSARAILGRCAAIVDMGPFAPVRGRPGFLQAALQTIASLKSGRCWSEMFEEVAVRFPAPRADRMTALARLYSAYEEALSRRELCDAQDTVAYAIARVKDQKRPLPPALEGASQIVVEDIYDWQPLRLELFVALAERFEREGRGQTLRILLPHDPERPELMAFVDPVWEQLYRRAQQGGSLEILPKAYGTDGAAPAKLARALFRAPAPTWEGPPAATVVSLAGPTEEARDIARRVRDLVDAGEAPESVMVAVRRLDDDAQRIVEALEKYGVPARIRRGVSLLSVPLAELAVDLVTLRRDGFPRDGLEALLARGLPRAFATQAGPLIRAIRECGMRTDRDLDRATGWIAALEKLAERRSRSSRGDVEGARRAIEAVQAIAEAVSELPMEPAPVSKHAKALLHALDKLGALERTDTNAARKATLDNAVAVSSLARDQLAVREVVATLEGLPEAFQMAGRSREPLDAVAFAALLADAFSESSLPARGPRGGAVRVVEVRELVGRRVAHLFIAGLVDGRFPAAPEPHPLLADEDRARLNTLLGFEVFRMKTGAEGPLPERQAEEPLLFHLALCSATSQLTLSFARSEESGRENIASRFIEELLRVEGAAVKERAPLSILPLARDARTRRELLTRAALELKSDRALRPTAPDPSMDPAKCWGALREESAARLQSVEERIAAERERFLFFARGDAEAGPFSGGVGEKVAPSLARFFAFAKEKPLSARALSELGNCRFQGFASQVLRLKGEEEADASADAATRGDLYHRAMQLFMTERQGAGKLPLRGDEDDLEALGKALSEAALGIASERHLGHPALWALTVEEAGKLLARVVRMEGREPVFEGMVPWRFEAALGTTELPLLEIPGPEGEPPLLVGGRIDRIDATNGKVAVVDYKSSRASSLGQRFKETFLESEFQLALYAVAVGAARKAEADAAFVSLRSAEVLKLSQLLLKMNLAPQDVLALEPSARKTLREQSPEIPNLGDRVWTVVKDAREGRFPIRAIDCRYCDYAAVCRVGGKMELEEGAE